MISAKDFLKIIVAATFGTTAAQKSLKESYLKQRKVCIKVCTGKL